MTDPHAFLTVVANDGTTLITKIIEASIERTMDIDPSRSYFTIKGYGTDSVQGEDMASAVGVALAQAYDRTPPEDKVETVEDLTLGHARELARIRVTTDDGVYEGPLKAISTSVQTGIYGRASLQVGGAHFDAHLNDMVEVLA